MYDNLCFSHFHLEIVNITFYNELFYLSCTTYIPSQLDWTSFVFPPLYYYYYHKGAHGIKAAYV
jgi:hypothetical protein